MGALLHSEAWKQNVFFRSKLSWSNAINEVQAQMELQYCIMVIFLISFIFLLFFLRLRNQISAEKCFSKQDSFWISLPQYEAIYCQYTEQQEESITSERKFIVQHKSKKLCQRPGTVSKLFSKQFKIQRLIWKRQRILINVAIILIMFIADSTKLS